MVFEIPLHVTKNHEIEQAIVIEVHPSRAGGPAAAAHARFFRDIGKRSVAVVVVQPVAAVFGDKQVFETVVVVIAYRHAVSIAHPLHPRSLGHVFERAVGFLVVQAMPVLGVGLARDRAQRSGIADGRAIHQENVQPAVIVVVEQGDAGAHDLQHVFLGGLRGVMMELHAAGDGHVHKVRRHDIRLLPRQAGLRPRSQKPETKNQRTRQRSRRAGSSYHLGS